jgi:hypothetical protein
MNNEELRDFNKKRKIYECKLERLHLSSVICHLSCASPAGEKINSLDGPTM